MDVHCSKCGEPWDTDTLRHDIAEDLPDDTRQFWQAGKLSGIEGEADVRADLFQWGGGWKFGANTLVILQCPACKDKSPVKKVESRLQQMMADLYGDDLDGLAADMEDFDL